MMHAASTRYLVRTASALALTCAISYGAYSVRDREAAMATLEGALAADYQRLPDLLPELAAHRAIIRPTLEKLEADSSTRPHEREVAAILLYRDQPTPERAAFLRDRLVVAGPDEVEVIRNALAVHPRSAGKDDLRGVLVDESAELGARLRVACALAAIEPGVHAISGTIAALLTDALLAEHRRELPRWLKLLGASAGPLVPPLGVICSDASRGAGNQSTAAEALADILKRERQPAALALASVESTEVASRVLLRELVSLGPSGPVFGALREVLAETVADPEDEPGKDALAGRQAAAAIALAALGQPEALWPLLRHRADPRVRSFLVERLAADTLSPRILLDRLLLPDIDPIERQALLLVWSEMRHPAVAAPMTLAVIARARALYLNDPHPAVHSAAELLLRRWGGPELLRQCADALREQTVPQSALRWELGPNGHTLVVLPAPLEFRMGAPPHENSHYHDPIMHYRKIERSIAVATKEVTVEQFQAFNAAHHNEPRYGDQPGCAAIHISWFSAAAYCNWLSARAGIEPEQWCYPKKIETGMMITEESVKRAGFRLPTEAEWEYFCRAGTETSRPYGESIELLPRYAWTWLNSGNRVMPPGLLLPNEFGLFDVLGNTWEWCQGGTLGHYAHGVTGLPPYPRSTRENPAPDTVPTETIDSMDRAHETWRILRGGAYSYAPDRARSAFRDWQPSGDNREYLGFRVVRTMP